MGKWSVLRQRRIAGVGAAAACLVVAVAWAQERPVPTVPADGAETLSDPIARALKDVEQSLELYERVAMQLKALTPEKLQELAVTGLAELIQKTEALLQDTKESLEVSMKRMKAMEETPGSEASHTVTEVVAVKNAGVDDVAAALQALANAPEGRPARPGPTTMSLRVVPNRELGTVVISGPAPEVRRLVELAGKLDRAPDPVANVELLLYVLRGTPQGEGGTAAPPQLAPSIERLTTLFPYANYSLVDTILLRSRDQGKSSATSAVPYAGGTLRQTIEVNSITVAKNSADIRLGSLLYQATFEEPPKPVEPPVSGAPAPPRPVMRVSRNEPQTSLFADLDLVSGEQAIAGKASLGNDDSALFLVVTARVVEPKAP